MSIAAELTTRLISAAVLIALALFALFYHPHSFTMLLIIGGVIALKEWRTLNVPRRLYFSLLTTLYTLAALVSLWWLRHDSVAPVLCLFAIVWGSDSAGYLFGKMLRGPLCWPNISPKKTWSGTLCALIAGTALGYGSLKYFMLTNGSLALIIPFFTTLAAIAGDALESHLKRRAGVKDSGTLIPGHGGLLDRIDALLAASIVFVGSSLLIAAL